MTHEIDPKIKLSAKLEALRISRGNIDNAYKKLDDWKKLRKTFKKQGKDVSVLEYKISVLDSHLDLIENNGDNIFYESTDN